MTTHSAHARTLAGGSAAEVPADITEDSVTDAVLDSLHATTDGRLREALEVLTKHLHAAVRELEPTLREWETVIDYLTATGQTCTDVRQEFILLSDVLGVSSLVENINHRTSEKATQATVLGPFHMTASPTRALGDRISRTDGNQECVVTGTVAGSDGRPLAGALVDVWQADTEGFYDVQQPGLQEPGNGRGLFTTDADGTFWLVTVVPAAYPIPTDGPVGDLLRRTGRHAYRPAHIHFIAAAEGYSPVTTHIFVAGSDYLDSDAVFAVKRGLVREFGESTDDAQAATFGVSTPFRRATIDLVLDRYHQG